MRFVATVGLVLAALAAWAGYVNDKGFARSEIGEASAPTHFVRMSPNGQFAAFITANHTLNGLTFPIGRGSLVVRNVSTGQFRSLLSVGGFDFSDTYSNLYGVNYNKVPLSISDDGRWIMVVGRGFAPGIRQPYLLDTVNDASYKILPAADTNDCDLLYHGIDTALGKAYVTVKRHRTYESWAFDLTTKTSTRFQDTIGLQEFSRKALYVDHIPGGKAFAVLTSIRLVQSDPTTGIDFYYWEPATRTASRYVFGSAYPVLINAAGMMDGGRYLAATTTLRLDPLDVDDRASIYVADRTTGGVQVVPVDAAGTRYDVGYLLEVAENSTRFIFSRFDAGNEVGVVATLGSADRTLIQGNFYAETARISASGNVIAYTANGFGPFPNDRNSRIDAVAWNIPAGTYTGLSQGTERGFMPVDHVLTDASGRFAFYTARDSTGKDVNFVDDLLTGAREPIYTPTGADAANRMFEPNPSGSGRYVAFTMQSGSRRQIWYLDRKLDQVKIISRSPTSTLGNRDSGRPVISPHGGFVAYQSLATNIVPGNTSNFFQLMFHHVTRGTTTMVTQGVNGVVDQTHFSGNSRRLAFSHTGQMPNANGDWPSLFQPRPYVYDVDTNRVLGAPYDPRATLIGATNVRTIGRILFSPDGNTATYWMYNNSGYAARATWNLMTNTATFEPLASITEFVIGGSIYGRRYAMPGDIPNTVKIYDRVTGTVSTVQQSTAFSIYDPIETIADTEPYVLGRDNNNYGLRVRLVPDP